jgi:hypothetical protein
MMNRIPERASLTAGVDAPVEYVDLLGLTGGLNFGEVALCSAKRVEKSQFYVDRRR